MWQYNQTNELYHFGIPGMRWGHRKAVYEYNVNKTKAKSYANDYKLERDLAKAEYTKAKKKYKNNKSDTNAKEKMDKAKAEYDNKNDSYKNVSKSIKEDLKEQKAKIHANDTIKTIATLAVIGAGSYAVKKYLTSKQNKNLLEIPNEKLIKSKEKVEKLIEPKEKVLKTKKVKEKVLNTKKAKEKVSDLFPSVNKSKSLALPTTALTVSSANKSKSLALPTTALTISNASNYKQKYEGLVLDTFKVRDL